MSNFYGDLQCFDADEKNPLVVVVAVVVVAVAVDVVEVVVVVVVDVALGFVEI